MSQLKKVVEKIGGIVLSGALVLNTLGSVPQLKVHAVPSETSVSGMGVSTEVGKFLNANALNEWDATASNYKASATSAKAHVYFGGNEYNIVNAHEDITLVAYKPYVDSVEFNSSSDKSDVKYNNSKAHQYLTKTDSTQVYSAGKANLYTDFFASKREFEWDCVEKSTIYTGNPEENNSYIVNAEEDITDNESNIDKLKDQKFYLPGGMWKDSTENYAYAGSREDQQPGYAVHCELFDMSHGTDYKYAPWLRSAL